MGTRSKFRIAARIAGTITFLYPLFVWNDDGWWLIAPTIALIVCGILYFVFLFVGDFWPDDRINHPK
jgi:hypothetical protein